MMVMVTMDVVLLNPMIKTQFAPERLAKDPDITVLIEQTTKMPVDWPRQDQVPYVINQATALLHQVLQEA
jgi:hypothetical protein